MNTRTSIAFGLECAIAAELALFAFYLLSGPRRRPSVALYLLAALALCMASMVTGNLLLGYVKSGGIADAVLFLDLLTPPLVFLYMTEMRREPRLLSRADGLHAAPALLGLAIWETDLLPAMDLYVNATWLGYLLATGYIFATQYDAYAPKPRQRFVILLLGALAAIWLLRLVIVLRAPLEPSFREGLPYLLILAAVFATTCLVLLTALRHPDLLSVPGSHVKYGLLPGDEAELDRLNERLVQLDSTRPFLDPDFSLARMAALLDAPPRQISQLINARHGTNVAAYINRRRVEAAAQLLSGTDRPIKAIVFESGFRSKSIFNREFQRCFGISPSEYRRRADGGSEAQ